MASPPLARYAALLRGVSPMNCKMPALKAAFEAGGFEDVKTVLSSGNVLFSAPRAPGNGLTKLRTKVEAAIAEGLGRPFMTFLEPIDELRKLLDADPFEAFALPAGAKRVVTFLRAVPARKPKLPVSQDGATIYGLHAHRVLSAYVVSDKGPVFMTLLQKTFGEEITTRTWDTVKRLAA